MCSILIVIALLLLSDEKYDITLVTNPGEQVTISQS